MADDIEARLAALGVELPAAPAPAANYTPFVVSGDLLFVSGQIAQDENGPMRGKLGVDADVAAGKEAARRCALALLAQAKAACEGDLTKIKRLVKLGGFVNAGPDFTEHPEVVNGASDVMVAVLGEAGVHARAAVGCGSLPRGVMVEIEAIFEID